MILFVLAGYVGVSDHLCPCDPEYPDGDLCQCCRIIRHCRCASTSRATDEICIPCEFKSWACDLKEGEKIHKHIHFLYSLKYYLPRKTNTCVCVFSTNEKMRVSDLFKRTLLSYNEILKKSTTLFM